MSDTPDVIYVTTSEYHADISRYTRSGASRVIVTDDQGERVVKVISLRGRPDPLLDR